MNDACAYRAEEAWTEDLGDPVSGPVPIEDSRADPGVAEAPVSGPIATWGWRSVTGGAAARAEEITRTYGEPGADPYADTELSFKGGALQTPEWCVDLGVVMLTMTTFELWTSVERGDVPPETRVWREGMEGWTCIGSLPEFSWSVPGANSPAPEPVDDVASRSTAEPDAAEATTGPFAPASRARGDESAGSAESDEEELRPAGVPSRRWWSSKRLPRSAKWIALGSAIAAGAIVTALLARGASSEPSASSASSEEPVEVTVRTGPAAGDAVGGDPAAAANAERPSPAADRQAAGAADHAGEQGDHDARSAARPGPLPSDESRLVHEEPGRRRLRRGPKRHVW